MSRTSVQIAHPQFQAAPAAADIAGTMLITLLFVPFVGLPLLLVVGQLIRPVRPAREIEASRWSMRDFRPRQD